MTHMQRLGGQREESFPQQHPLWVLRAKVPVICQATWGSPTYGRGTGLRSHDPQKSPLPFLLPSLLSPSPLLCPLPFFANR